jgi:hypothetical protein
MSTDTYTIYRYYSDTRPSKIMHRNYTLEKAHAHCSDPITSSKTHPRGRNGVTCDWFDGYNKN